MAQSLTQIAQSLKNPNKKVQLIYAFNGTGKTRLSREFKDLIAPKNTEVEAEETKIKILYYNAFTEDLFFWDNDLDNDTDRKLKIQPNNYTSWILQDQGQEPNITAHFQRYTSDKLTPRFNEDFSEVRFSFERGDDSGTDFVKISKGEESCFIWSVFYSILEQTISELNLVEEGDRETDQFNDLQYVFIDDPVSSLDDNHLIELAVNLAELVKKSTNLKFIVSTHSPLFYNVLYNELNLKSKKEVCFMLDKKEDGTFELIEKFGDSNKSFSYHLFLKQTIEEAIATNSIQKYHFTLLRNLYEKTANFLGYPQWSNLLPNDKQTYYNRIIQFTSHSTLSNEEVPEPTEPEKQTVKFLLEHLVDNNYWKEEQNGTL
ncbi:MAG: AAA family ATPase [Flavobacterium sp.]|nr:AAA family ATPase [Flavobacterium sp.]